MRDYWIEYQRRRWMKPNAAVWMRPDAARWLLPNQKIWMGLKNREAKYSPEQPRVPAGNLDGGQWTEGGGARQSEAGARQSEANVQMAGSVIPICIASGISRFTVAGVKSFSVTYDCAGGQTITITGFGNRYDGIIRDPFRT
jgi:hypothetical protein